jgi:DNA processing protein
MKKNILALHQCGINTYTKIKKLQFFFDDLSQCFKAAPRFLREAGLSERQAEKVTKFKPSMIEPALAWEETKNHTLLHCEHADYPPLLKEIAQPPSLLYIKGNDAQLLMPQLGIVGSRKPSPWGRENAVAFGKALVEVGFTVTSGLALGVDAAAHAGALRKGKTIAVLGTGIDTIYPWRNRALAEEIIENGAIISEFPLGAKPCREHFPQRNRIISGLSYGVLVVEAALKSGSLITARYAMEQGREVFAIPGPINHPASKGCHALIRQGATLTEGLDDICSELKGMIELQHENMSLTPSSEQEKLDFTIKNEEDRKILDVTGIEPTSVETIINRTELSSELVLGALLRLELRKLVKSVPGGYSRIR